MPLDRPSRRAATGATTALRASSSRSDAAMSDHEQEPSSSSKKVPGKGKRVVKKKTTRVTAVGGDDEDDEVLLSPTQSCSKRQSVSAPTTPPPKSSQSRDPLSPSYPAFPEFISTPSKLRKRDLELANAPLEEPPLLPMVKKTPQTPSKRLQKVDAEGIPSAKKTKTATTPSPSAPYAPPPLISKYEIPSDLLDIPSDYSTDSDSAPRPSASAPSASMASGLTSKVIEPDDDDDDSFPELPDLDWQMDEVVFKKKKEEVDEVISRRDTKLADGTIVYYKDQRAQYWPGRIVGYEPATSSRKKGERYLVQDIIAASQKNFNTKARRAKPYSKRREEIISVRDEAIATCKLGVVGIKALKPPEASDADVRESTSPLPNDADSMTSAEFENLTYAQQIQAIRPHLELIIAEQYPPAQKSIDNTYNEKYPAPPVRGDIPDMVIDDVFMPELRRWALRRERWGKYQRGEEQERPVGSERYEEMTPEQRDSFVIRLLPAEAVRQIFIKVNEYESLTSDELLELIDAFDPPEDLRQEFTTSYSQPQLMRLLTDLSLDEQAGIRDTQTQEVIKHLREQRNAMRKQLGLPVPEGGAKDILVDIRGRPVRQAVGKRARVG